VETEPAKVEEPILTEAEQREKQEKTSQSCGVLLMYLTNDVQFSIFAIGFKRASLPAIRLLKRKKWRT
jgi:hypothetical protein